MNGRVFAERHAAIRLTAQVEKLYEYLQTYLIEVSLEIVSRTTEISASPATLETMFEPERTVEVQRR